MNDLQEATMAASLRQAHAEARVMTERAFKAERRNAVLEASQRVQVTREPLTYEPGSQNSWFYDVARARRAHSPGAKERLERHQREMAVEMPKRAERRARALASYEATFAADPDGAAALTRMTAAGISPFEQRAMTRTPGAGGYFDPPAYLLDRYVPYAREGSPFASRWTTLDLPPATSSVNVPRLALGAAVGAQTDIAPTGTRDIQDSLVSAPVRTIAGHADASMQWLEQGQGSGGYGVDDMLWADLTADLAQNIDGQCLLGAGANGQLLGVWPSGAIAAANGIVQADSNNATSQTWTVASTGASLHVNLAQTVSLARRIRAAVPGWVWFWHPWVWSLYTAAVDGQNRPLVADQDLDGLPPGVLGYYQNIPVVGDNNIPTTFGGAAAPSIGTLTNGQYAAIAGTGTGASYTPMLLARPADLFIFAGDVRMQILTEVLSGTGQVRFQCFQYLAAMPNRYVAAAAVGSSVSAGGDVAHATCTWQQTNSLLQLSGSGY